MNKISQRIEDLSPAKRALLELRLKHTRAALVRSIRPRADRSSALASFAQQRLWFLDQLEPNQAFYNIPRVINITGPLDVGGLEAALKELVTRHEALRTHLVLVNDTLRQLIDEHVPIPLVIIDLGGVPAAGRERASARLLKEEADRPFDLSRGPLIRATLFRLADDEHILILTTHHIVGDGWSAGILFRELSQLYEAFANGRPSPLEPLSIQYPDFAEWQREWLQGDTLQTQLSYWQKQLANVQAVLNLPTDRPRPAVQTFRGSHRSATLTARLSEQLIELCRRQDVTLFMTLLAAFQTLLYRYTGQDDIVVGSPIAGRNRPEIEDLIGFFINTLALRSDLSGNPRFSELLSRVKDTALGAYANQDLPFEKLVEEIQPERDLARNPLFQVMLQLQNAPRQVRELTGLTLRSITVPRDSAKFDLFLVAYEGDGRLNLEVEYSTDLFDEPTIDRMLGHYEALLEGIVADPDVRISKLPLLSPAERQRLVEEWNETEAEFSREQRLNGLFEEQAQQSPENEAIVFENERLTYGELNGRANQLAHYLRRRGVGPEVLVGVFMERSVEMVVGLLGILKAGGAYVPLDPKYPQERLGYMLAEAEVPLVLTQRRLLERLPASRARAVCVDDDWEQVREQSEENPEPQAGAENLAYVIYTSGSTGQPKGVAIAHRSAVGLVEWAKGVYSAEELAGVLGSTSICFDLSIFEIFVPLSLGGRVILAKDALHLATLSAGREVKLINTVPSVMVELMRLGGVPETVRTINLAGEPLTGSLVEEIYQQPNIEQVYDLYGPSEDTTYSTFALRQAEGATTIGRPITNTKIYIVDENLEPVPIGVPGELYIGGEGLARGYLKRPDLTAERFVPNPFTAQGTGRLYQTGDVARYLPDGNIQYLGRVDHQIKLRGFRIELGEIEAILRQHADVAQAVSIIREDQPGDKRLVAYVVPTDGQEVKGSELRNYLAEKLPEYMIPSAMVELPELPLTPNGKLNRKALPAPDYSAQPRQVYVAPRTPLEESLVGMWAEVLKVTRVGINDNFFKLGGHSLLATQLISRVRNTFNVELPLRHLFEAPTVAGLAPAIIESQQEGADSRPEAITRDSTNDAKGLLTRIDQLSDEEVDSLLNDVLVKTGDSE